MKPRDPARSASAYRERELRSITPFLGAALDLRRIDDALPDALHGIADDRLLGRQLGLVRHVLQLAAAPVVSRVVRAGRLDANGRGRHDAPERAAREMPFARYLRRHDIAGRRPRNEHDEPIAPSDAVSARRDRVDRNA